MLKRELRFLACLTTLVSAGYGCSLTVDTDGLSGGADASVGDATMQTDGSGGTDATSDAPVGMVCPNGDVLGSSTSCGSCGFDCVGGACSDGVCQPVVMAIAGQARAVLVFSTYGIVWSSVTTANAGASAACATVAPAVYGLAANSFLNDGGSVNSSVFMVGHSSSSAYYASALSADLTGIYLQDTAPTAGANIHAVGFANNKPAGSVPGGAVFGLAQPASGDVNGTVMVYFADSTSTPGPHEFNAGEPASQDDSTGTLPLDPNAPPELATPYKTASLAVDDTYAYYGTDGGVYRIKLGATCVSTTPDGGKKGDAGSSCEGLFVNATTAAQVTAVMVDPQYLFVATADGLLTRYDTVDGANPVMLSSAGPFYGITQDVDTSTATPTYGATVYAASAKGPIVELAKDGTSTKTLGTSTLVPVGIAVNGNTVYWVENGDTDPTTLCARGNGRLMRVRK